jgi:methyl-accepting chemotaxis protein
VISNLQQAIGATVAAVEDFSTARNCADEVKGKLEEISIILVQADQEMGNGQAKLQEIKSWLEETEATLFEKLGTDSTVAQGAAQASEAAAQVAIMAADVREEVGSAAEHMLASEAGTSVVQEQTAHLAAQAENLANILGALE